MGYLKHLQETDPNVSIQIPPGNHKTPVRISDSCYQTRTLNPLNTELNPICQ